MSITPVVTQEIRQTLVVKTLSSPYSCLYYPGPSLSLHRYCRRFQSPCLAILLTWTLYFDLPCNKGPLADYILDLMQCTACAYREGMDSWAYLERRSSSLKSVCVFVDSLWTRFVLVGEAYCFCNRFYSYPWALVPVQSLTTLVDLIASYLCSCVWILRASRRCTVLRGVNWRIGYALSVSKYHLLIQS
jgi:hypothetical protein